jgi:hypothetical protein
MTITEIVTVARRRRRTAAIRRARAAFPAFVPADRAALAHANAVARLVAARSRAAR